ncbi:Guanine nucleotide-binding protein subunit gamma 3 [Camellia lanceoleosa]|uniref:Guanine nucleotide-binding protein subunit gamma 3 n=1 Tax=Camellia lanceoleosa TaxID=1840588 RepID=A0ACC0FDD2_9ERIC|nr:Guanine nucleotide-binding protein subunit gamma 3 [Camellia lanceoleosa]
MTSSLSCNSEPLPLPPPSPKSPPSCPDLYGKRRQMAKVQFLEREIAMLEEELKSLEGVQLASRCCKELDDFIDARADPLLATDQKTSRSHYFWKRFWGKFDLKWICGFHGRCIHLQTPICCACSSPNNTPRGSSNCCSCRKCCNCLDLSCPRCNCSGFHSCFPRCIKVKLCSKCTKACCCDPCNLYY